MSAVADEQKAAPAPAPATPQAEALPKPVFPGIAAGVAEVGNALAHPSRTIQKTAPYLRDLGEMVSTGVHNLLNPVRVPEDTARPTIDEALTYAGSLTRGVAETGGTPPMIPYKQAPTRAEFFEKLTTLASDPKKLNRWTQEALGLPLSESDIRRLLIELQADQEDKDEESKDHDDFPVRNNAIEMVDL